MNLWDEIIDPHEPDLEALRSAQRSELAMSVIQATTELLNRPSNDFFPATHAALIQSAIEVRLTSPSEWQLHTSFAENFLTQYDELPEVAVKPGVGPLLMALVRLFEAPTHSLSADDAMEILSSCYEAVLMSQLTGRVTLGDEQNNSRCREAINIQLRLVTNDVPPQ